MSIAICTSGNSREYQSILDEKNRHGRELIVELNNLTYTVAEQHDHFYSFVGIRALTMVHLAIHDAFNAVEPEFETYAYHRKQPKANAHMAAVKATRTILLNIYPDRRDTILQVCDRLIGIEPSSKPKQEGLALGDAIAKVYLELREGDGHEKQGDYTPMTKPGDYQYTPGWNNWVLKPDFSYARPFALDSVTQFRSPSPPSLSSEEYVQSFNEVKSYGMKKSTVRSKDQTEYAHWWAEFAEHSWNRIARIAAEARELSIHETARLFALVNMNIYDIYLASLESKYHYDTWRPFTAIRSAGQDGNSKTDPDRDWEPEMLTPPWPEYPSAHAAVGAGGAEIMAHVLGSPKFTFSMESTSCLADARIRTYYDLNDAANECADSRIMNGYHFRFATEEGKLQGRRIAQYIAATYLKPLE
ncbi:MAG: phosphatase PAP2 family protein [Bacteroidota bacterium]